MRARSPATGRLRITLRDVYRSTLDTKPLWDPRPDGPHVCVVSSNAYNYFAR